MTSLCSADNVTQFLPRAGRAAIDRYLLPDRAHSSKPAAHCCRGRYMGQTDRRTDRAIPKCPPPGEAGIESVGRRWHSRIGRARTYGSTRDAGRCRSSRRDRYIRRNRCVCRIHTSPYRHSTTDVQRTGRHTCSRSDERSCRHVGLHTRYDTIRDAVLSSRSWLAATYLAKIGGNSSCT